MISEDEVSKKSKTHLVPLVCFSDINLQPGSLCISRLTYFACIVIITFIVCISQEFTFVLNYTGYSTTSNTLEEYLTSNNASTESFKLYPGKEHISVDGGDDWRTVTDNIYAYSAFWDDRLKTESFVRIVGGANIAETNLSSTKCLLRYNLSSIVLEVVTKHTILREHHNKPSRAVYFKCNADVRPYYVAVVSINWNRTCNTKISWLTVHSLRNTTEFSNIGVCIRPMFNYTDAFRIAEFISYYEALGVSHFTFYLYNVVKDITDFLLKLKENSYSIDILPFSLPKELATMWSVGQLASINDCIYRQMHKLKYIAIVDLDEFMTPRHVVTLKEVLKKQDITEKKFGSFVFRSCLFCAEYEQDVLPPVILPFLTQNSIRRENFIYPYLVRTKYIAKSRLVEVAGIHYVSKFIPGFEEHFVPASQVLVHHYRSDLCVGKNKTLEKGEIDVKSRKYINNLMRSKATKVWKQMFL